MVRAYTTGLLTVLSLLVARAGAQTTMPVGADGSSILAIPAGWVKTSDIATSQGFRPGIAGQIVASFHPENARPTDIPYAILEHIDPEPNPGNASVWYAAPHVQAKYAQAIDPPSRADLAGTWKSSQVTKPVFGPNGFTFRATVNYVGGVSGNHTYYVNVLGHYEAEGTTVLSVWADQNARSAYSASIDELSTAGLRPPPKLLGPPPVSFQERLVSWAKISGVMLILFVVGVQVWVIVPRAKTAAGGRGGRGGNRWCKSDHRHLRCTAKPRRVTRSDDDRERRYTRGPYAEADH